MQSRDTHEGTETRTDKDRKKDREIHTDSQTATRSSRSAVSVHCVFISLAKVSFAINSWECLELFLMAYFGIHWKHTQKLYALAAIAPRDLNFSTT